MKKPFLPLHSKSFRNLITYVAPRIRSGELPRLQHQYIILEDVDTGFISLQLIDTLVNEGFIRRSQYFVSSNGTMIEVKDSTELRNNPITGEGLTYEQFNSSIKYLIEIIDTQFFLDHEQLYNEHDSKVELLSNELSSSKPDISDFTFEAAKDTTIEPQYETSFVQASTKVSV